MKTHIVAYCTTLVVFVAIDFIWLSTMADLLYRPVMGDMLAPEFRLAPAVVFYLLYVAGLTFLAVRPGLASASIAKAALCGAVLGFTAYATYDLTNQSTLTNWSMTLTIADMVWGTFLSAIASSAGCAIARRFGDPARMLRG
ncbi:putative membrane protein [Pararhizobium capsulatum DSM 1112]|uniref:Membrane protein n=1 Tax=Pararhizobium capsulatum DSM 1112 TaxID=1121113 RepID=A0ABU0BUN7_9HYPH|nr:DUF2177 family protein [Pararhizobium capsulatum]MDQ0321964.1 putative membrane protein [Pararhizobium capsulatum DSM 1112]